MGKYIEKYCAGCKNYFFGSKNGDVSCTVCLLKNKKDFTCFTCGKAFLPKSQQAKYCDNCKNASTKAYEGLSTATTGAIAEYIVTIDLLKRGYEVFKAVSPSCSCDIAVLKNGELKRIEVRTGSVSRLTGEVRCGLDNFRADILAVVIHKTGKIYYKPEI